MKALGLSAALSAGLWIHATPAVAIVIDAPIPPGVNGSGPGGFAGWIARYDTVQNGNTVDVSWNPIVSRLDIKLDYTQIAPIVITFIEQPVIVEEQGPFGPILVAKPPSMDSPQSNGGLNVIIREFIKNNTPEDWTSFHWVLSDNTPVNENGVPLGDFAAHPLPPHFHNVGGGFLPFTTFNNFDPKAFIDLTNGPFENDGIERTWESVRLHDREVKGVLRSFTLTEYPVPEPPAVALMGVAVLTLWLAGWLREKTSRRFQSTARA
jgi:hypothetical protein